MSSLLIQLAAAFSNALADNKLASIQVLYVWTSFGVVAGPSIFVATLGYNTWSKLQGRPVHILWPDIRILPSRAVCPKNWSANLTFFLSLSLFGGVLISTFHPLHTQLPYELLFLAFAGTMLTIWAWTWFLAAKQGRWVSGLYTAEVFGMWIKIILTLQSQPSAFAFGG